MAGEASRLYFTFSSVASLAISPLRLFADAAAGGNSSERCADRRGRLQRGEEGVSTTPPVIVVRLLFARPPPSLGRFQPTRRVHCPVYPSHVRLFSSLSLSPPRYHTHSLTHSRFVFFGRRDRWLRARPSGCELRVPNCAPDSEYENRVSQSAALLGPRSPIAGRKIGKAEKLEKCEKAEQRGIKRG